MFGVIDFGYMLNRDTVINNAAREGVRTASAGGTSAEVVQTVKDYLPGLPGTLTVTVTLHQAGRHGVHELRHRCGVGRDRHRQGHLPAPVGDPGGVDVRWQDDHASSKTSRMRIE